jgi:hypothetical protein
MSKQQMPVTKCFTSSNTSLPEELCKPECRERLGNSREVMAGEFHLKLMPKKARPGEPDGPLR